MLSSTDKKDHLKLPELKELILIPNINRLRSEKDKNMDKLWENSEKNFNKKAKLPEQFALSLF